MNSSTSGPSAHCSKLLVSDTTTFFDQNTCFFMDILVSKQKISYLLDFDRRKSFLKNLKTVRKKVLIKSFTNREVVNFFKVFIPTWLLLYRQYLILLFWIKKTELRARETFVNNIIRKTRILNPSSSLKPNDKILNLVHPFHFYRLTSE